MQITHDHIHHLEHYQHMEVVPLHTLYLQQFIKEPIPLLVRRLEHNISMAHRVASSVSMADLKNHGHGIYFLQNLLKFVKILILNNLLTFSAISLELFQDFGNIYFEHHISLHFSNNLLRTCFLSP